MSTLAERAVARTPRRLSLRLGGMSDRAIAWLFITPSVLLLLAVIALAAWLLVRPPRDTRDATVRLIVLYAVLFTLAPSTRFGYYAYPLALVGWLVLTKRKSNTDDPERLVGPPPGPH